MELPTLWEGDPCPLCRARGTQSKLKFYLPNLHEATLLCERPRCPFPFTTRYPDVFVPVDKHGNIIRGTQCGNIGKYEDDDSDDSLHLSDTSEDEMCFPEDEMFFPGEGPEIKKISAFSLEKGNNSKCDLGIFDISTIDFHSDDNIDIKDIKEEIAALEMIIAEENKYDSLNYVQESFLNSDLSLKEEKKSDDCVESHKNVSRNNESGGRGSGNPNPSVNENDDRGESDGVDVGNPNTSVHENITQNDESEGRDSANPNASLHEKVTMRNERDGKDTGNQETTNISKNCSRQSDSGKTSLDSEDDKNDSKSENANQLKPVPESEFIECFDSTEIDDCCEDSQAESTDKEDPLICEMSTTDISENISNVLHDNSLPVNSLEGSNSFIETSVTTDVIKTVPGTSQQSEDGANLNRSVESLGTPIATSGKLIKSILKQPGKPSSTQPKKVFIIVPLDKDRMSIRKRMNKELSSVQVKRKKEVQCVEDIEVIYDDDEKSGEYRIVAVTNKQTSSHNEDSCKNHVVLNRDSERDTESRISKMRAIVRSENGNNGFGRGRVRVRGRGRGRGRGSINYTAFHSNRIHSQDCVCYLCTDNAQMGETLHLDRALADVFSEQPVLELEEKVRTRRDDAEEFIDYMTGRKKEPRRKFRKKRRLFHL